MSLRKRYPMFTLRRLPFSILAEEEYLMRMSFLEALSSADLLAGIDT
jgi:hypothetical protein